MGLTANVVAGAPILSAWGNEIRDRSVQNFTNVAERSAQWTAPPEGAFSYLRDVDRVEVYNGTAWVDLSLAATGGYGEVFFYRHSADVGIPGGSPVRMNMGGMATLRQNRKYKFTWIGQVSHTALSNVNLQIRVGTVTGASPATQDTINRVAFGGTAGAFQTYVITGRYLMANPTGSYEVMLWAGTSAAATIVQGAGAFTDLLVEDIGQ